MLIYAGMKAIFTKGNIMDREVSLLLKGQWENCSDNGNGKFTGVNGTIYEG